MFWGRNWATADRGHRLWGATACLALAISTLATIAISTPATATQLEMKGESARFKAETLDCPGGYAMGLTARTGAWFDALGVVCATFDPATGHLVAAGHTNQSGDTGGSYQDRSCPADQAIEYVQFSMFEIANPELGDPSDNITKLDDIIFRCRLVTALAPDYANDPNFLMKSDDAVVISGAHSRTPSIVGSDVNYGFSHNEICPDGELAVGFRVVGNHGSTINENGVFQLGMDCGAVPAKPSSPTLPPAPPGAKSGTDRPGSDFKSYPLNDPAACQAKCQADGACKAWTWAVPGTNGAGPATCYLKNPAPAEVAAGCCISGVPIALPPAQGGAKAGVDLPGSDFFSFTSNDQSICALSCSKDARCKAWTWAVAGTNGVKFATCYMKNAVPKEVANNCCVSGLPPTGGPVTLPPGALSGTDRPGGDLSSGPSPDPTSCAQACGTNGACKAWTWAVAGTNGQSAAICYLKGVVPKATANNCCVSGLAPAAGGGSAGGGSASLPAGAQTNTDRPGGDINSIPSGDPASCAQSCGSSPICKAWTWAVAGTNGSPQPRCYLKGVVPAPQPNPCCVSGLKMAGGGPSGGGGGFPPGGAGVPPGASPGADRPGGDFAVAPSLSPASCALSCGSSPICRAWTWAVPGTNGQPVAICYLKNVVPPQQPNPCCVSGVKSGGGGPGGGGAGPDFSGNWQTTINGSAPGTLTLFPAGGNWKGTYSALGISGVISNGHIGGDGHLRFSWSQPGATGKGDFVMTGPASFSGTFHFDANPGAVGSWNGHR